MSTLIRSFILMLITAVTFSACGCGGDSKSSGGGPIGPTPPVSTGALKVNGDTSSQHGNQKVVFNSGGTTGLAVWHAFNGWNYRILYSVYSGGTWSDEEELILNGSYPSVATDGANFMIVYNRNGNIYSNIFNGTSWGAETAVESGSSYSFNAVIARSTAGYAAAWIQYNGSRYVINACIYTDSGSSWGTPAAIESGTGSSNAPAIASNGAGYAVVWQQDNGTTYRIYANVYNGSVWGGAAIIDAGNYYAEIPALASNGTGYAAVWSQPDGTYTNIYANIHSGSSWGGAAVIDSSSNGAGSPVIASNGSGYGAAWFQWEASMGWSIFARIYNGSSWGTVEVLESSDAYAGLPSIASNGANYAVVWYQEDSAADNIYANIHNGAGWGTAISIESGTGKAGMPVIARKGTMYAASWHQIDAAGNSNIFASAYNGSSWSTEKNLSVNIYKGICESYSMATDKADRTIAVWQQYHNDMFYVYAAVNTGGIWSAPIVLAGDAAAYKNAYDPSIAVNSSTFMVIYHINGSIFARSFDGSAWGAETSLESGSGYSSNPVIASNGTGFAAVWKQWNMASSAYEINASIHNGTSWGTETKISTATGDNTYNTAIVSNGSGYAAAWLVDGSDYYIYGNIYDGSAWGTEVQIASSTDYLDRHVLSSNGAGYIAVWAQSDAPVRSIYANIYSGSSWSGPSAIESGSGYALSPAVASDGSGYMAVWTQLDSAAYSIFSNSYNGSWGTEAVIESEANNADLPAIASSGTGYCAVWNQYNSASGYYSIYSNIFDGSAWSGPVLIESNDSDAYNPLIISNGAKYSAIWNQVEASDPIARDIYAKLGF